MDGDALLFQTDSQVIECQRLGLALQLYTIVVEVEDGIRIGTVSIDKSRVYIVIANGTLPHALLTQVIAIGIATHGCLVIVQTLIDDIPFAYLTFIVCHHLGDVVLHDFQGFLAGPVLVVLLTVSRQPARHLRVPYQTVTADSHIVLLSETYQIVGTAKAETTLGRLQGIHLHFVLADHHVKLSASLTSVAVKTFIGTQRHTDALLSLIRIVFQRILVGSIIDAVIVEGSHGIDGVVGIFILVSVFSYLHVCIRLQTHDEDDMVVLLALLDYPCVFVGTHIEVPVGGRLAVDGQHTELRTDGDICCLLECHLYDWHLVAGREVFLDIVIAHSAIYQQLVIAVGCRHLKAQARRRTHGEVGV